MRVSRRNPRLTGKLGVAALALGLFFPAKIFSAETVTFHLRTGERIVGAIVSENTNGVVISNLWASELSIPLAQIEKRETNVVASSTQTAAVSTNAVSTPPKPPKPKLWHAQVDLGTDLLYGAKE